MSDIFNDFLEYDKRVRKDLENNRFEDKLIRTLEAPEQPRSREDEFSEFLDQEIKRQVAKTPAYEIKGSQEILKSSEDPMSEVQRMQNAKIMDQWAGFQPGFSLKNYDAIFEKIAGGTDPLSNGEYLRRKISNGEKTMLINELFFDFMNSSDPEVEKKIEELYAQMEHIPGGYGKGLEVLGMVAENTPQMLEGMRQGAIVGGATALGVAGIALASGIPLVALAGGALGTTGALSLGGSAFGVGMLSQQAQHSYVQMAGGFAHMLYSELKENGIEPDMQQIRGLANVVGSLSAVVESASVSTIMSTVPGLDKYFTKSLTKKMSDYLTNVARKKAVTAMGNAATRGAAAGVSKMGDIALVAGENAFEEVMQEIISETGRMIYDTASKANTMSREKAREELLAKGVVTPTVDMIDAYIGENPVERLPKRKAEELRDQYLKAAYAGAVVGGVLSAPGVTFQSLKAGTAEYTATKIHVDQIINEIVDRADSPEHVHDLILENEELRSLATNRTIKSLSNEFYDYRAIQEMEKDLYDRMWEDKDADIHKGEDGNYYNKEGEVIDILFQAPDGFYYNEWGEKTSKPPDNAKIKKFSQTEEGLYIDEKGETWMVPPWDSRRFKKNLITGEAQPYIVHRDPESGLYYDEDGMEFTQPPRGAYAKEWVKYEDGYAVDAEGNKAIGKPWEMGFEAPKRVNPRTGKPIANTKTVLTPKTPAERSKTLYLTAAEAKARYLKTMEDLTAQGYFDNESNVKPSYEEWSSQQNFAFVEHKARRFAVDTEADLRYYRHVVDYAERMNTYLSSEQQSYLSPSIERFKKILEDLDTGRLETYTFSDAISETKKQVADLHDEIGRLRLVEKNAKDSMVKDRAHQEIIQLRDKIAELTAENRTFEKFVNKTQMNMMAYYNQAQEQAEYLQRFGEMSREFAENEDFFNGSMSLNTVFELSEMTDAKGLEGSENIYSMYPSHGERMLAVGESKLRALVNDARQGAREEMMAQSRLKRSEKGNKDRIRNYIMDTMEMIFKPVPDTVYYQEARAIEEIQNMIDPNFRNTENLQKYEQAVRNIRDTMGDGEAIQEALAVLKKPLQEMTIDEYRHIHYTVEMLKDIGRVRKDMQRYKEQTKLSGLRDIAIDAANGLTAKALLKKYGTDEYNKLRGVEGIKNASLGLYSNYLVPEQVFDALDGFKDYKGPMVEFFVDERNRAHAEKLKNVSERRAVITNWLKETGYKRKRLFQKIPVFGKEFEVQEIMTMYAAYGVEGRHDGNEALQSTLVGNMNIHEGEARAAIEFLTKQDKDLADLMMDDYANVFPKLDEAVLQRTNQTLGRERNYIPIVYEFFDHIADGDADKIIYSEMLGKATFDEKKVSDSFTKERVAATVDMYERMADKPKAIRMGMFDVWSEMVEKHEHYIQMGDLARQMKKLVSDPDFEKAVKGKLGDGWYKSISSYVDAQVSPYGWKSYVPLDKLIRGVKHNSTISFLSYNLQTAMKQLPSMAFYVKYAGLPSMLSATGDFMINPYKFLEKVRERDPIYKNRGFAMEQLDWRKESGKGAVVRKVGKAGMLPIQFIDHIVVGIGNEAVYRKALNSGLSPQQALDYTRKVMNVSQPNADIGALPAIWRTNEAIRFTMMFGQQITKIFDMLTYETASNVANKKVGAEVANLAAIQISTMAIFMASAKRLPENDEEWMEMMAKGYLNYIPHVGRMIASASKGYAPSNVIQDITEDATQAWKAFEDDGLSIESTKKIMRDNITSLGVMLALPGNMIENILESMEEGDPWELIGGVQESEGSGGW